MSGAPRRAMRILQIETFGRGGLIHYSYNLSCALAKRGHDVTLLTAAAYELEGRALPPNLRLLTPIGRVSRRTDRILPAFAAALARKTEAVVDACVVAVVAWRLRPEVIHLHCTNPIALVYLALLRWLGVPVATTAHVVTAHERTRFQDRVYRRIHRSSALIIAHSEFDRNRLLDEFAVDPGRVVVIPHGDYGFFVDDGTPPERESARRSLGLAPSAEVALFFGYIREYKGLDVLLDAWPAVTGALPHARLVIAGDPVRLPSARRAELQAWAARLGAVHRFGYVPFADVTRYIAAADVLVLPYRHVSQSGVLFLALSLGLPVVATRVGGLPEMLRDDESALLVPPGSAVGLAEALIRSLGDPGLRDRLALGGRRVADRHSWPSIAERTEAVLVRLAEGLPPSA